MTAARHVVALTLAVALVVGLGLGQRVLVSNDEARFPLLAEDLLTHGPAMFPRLLDAPYFNKPALLAWLIALASWPEGEVTQRTAVLPSALAALAAVLAVYGLGRELLGPRAGLLAAMAALTTVGVVEFSSVPLPDMLMTLFIVAAVWMLARALRGAADAAWIGFYVFTAAAFWAKGPAGLLPLAVAAAVLFRRRRAEDWAALRPVPGLAVLAALVAPWWIGAALTNVAAMRRVVVTDQILWYAPRLWTTAAVTNPVRHALAIFAPWTLVAPFALHRAARAVGTGQRRDALDLLLTWAALTFALVALGFQQRFRYYLPLVPPLALLVGWWADGLVASSRRAARLVAVAAVGAALGLVVGFGAYTRGRNADNDFAGVVAALAPALHGDVAVGAWGVPNLPLAFYLGRPVTALRSAAEVRQALLAAPPAAVVALDTRLRAVGDAGIVPLAHGRIGGHAVTTVTERPWLLRAGL